MKDILKRYIDTSHVEHTDGTCGLCNKELIKSQVAKEYINKENVSIKDFYTEVENQWKNTPFYKEVQDLLKRGLSIDEVSKVMEKKGIII